MQTNLSYVCQTTSSVLYVCIEEPGQAKKPLAVRHRKHHNNNNLQGKFS
jgi:hypothetical protein